MSLRSLQAYQDILPKLKDKERRIMYALGDTHLNAEDISFKTGIPIITTRARLSEMYDRGIVAQTRKGLYYISPREDRANIEKARLEAKYEKWKKLGEKHGWHFRYDTTDKHGEPQPEDYKQESPIFGELPF